MTVSPSPIGGLEIWRGSVAPWQCDQMGHMNVRFYLTIAAEGLAGLAAGLGMPRAFSPGASSTLLVREHHVRFLKEARVGAGLVMTGGVLSMGEADAVLIQLLYHADGEPAAAVTARVSHVTPQDLKPFPWPKSARRLAEGLMVAAPDFSKPRGLSADPVATQASAQAADALELDVAASGAVGPQDCDVFARMQADQVIARIYSSIGHLFGPSEAAILEAAPALRGRLGGAVLEYRVLYHAWPQPGDRLQLRSGYRTSTQKNRAVVHWLLDPESGQPWATAELFHVYLDLKARKALTIPDAVFPLPTVKPKPGLTL